MLSDTSKAAMQRLASFAVICLDGSSRVCRDECVEAVILVEPVYPIPYAREKSNCRSMLFLSSHIPVPDSVQQREPRCAVFLPSSQHRKLRASHIRCPSPTCVSATRPECMTMPSSSCVLPGKIVAHGQIRPFCCPEIFDIHTRCSRNSRNSPNQRKKHSNPDISHNTGQKR